MSGNNGKGLKFMKFIKRFESKSITFDSSWNKYDKLNGFSDFGTNYWTKPLSKKGFTCIIVERLKKLFTEYS